MAYSPRTVVDPARWSAVVPVKLLRTAKTRISRLPGTARADLALAMALDTVTAARACPLVGRVVVVTDDDRARAAAGEAGAEVVPDAPDAGLNDALAYAAGEATRRWPDDGVTALAADLPAMKPEELATALEAAGATARAVLADATGDGTVLLTASAGTRLDPAYGEKSWQRHVAAGAEPLTIRAPGLQQDVDSISDLIGALALGCGARTTALADALGVAEVHATVREHDAGQRAGTVFLDDGTVLTYDAEAFDRGGLRSLRLGQRVRLATVGRGADVQVDAVTLATLPFPPVRAIGRTP